MRTNLTLLLMSIWVSLSGQITVEQLQTYLEENTFFPDTEVPSQTQTLLGKGQPDECFYDDAGQTNIYDPAGIDCASCVNDGGTPKTNQAYVWGMSKSNDKLWFGTAPNVHCLIIGTFFGIVDFPSVMLDSYVCEFGDSDFTSDFPNNLKDWRPARFYTYDIFNEEQMDITAQVTDMALLNATLGIRSVGSTEEVVIYAGPGISANGPVVNMFAFDAVTMEYLGAQQFTDYTNIRKWLYHDGVLYTAVGKEDGGAVLKWTGSLASPFQFEEVGALDGEGAELAVHNGKLFVTTWPIFQGIGAGVTSLASLYMSPDIPAGGLPASAAEWTKVWEADDYEPDPTTAFTYGGGAIASFDGHLYWGTMHVPLLSTFAHLFTNGGDITTIEEAVSGVLGPYRATAVFRAADFNAADDPDDHINNIELVYGNPTLPVFTSAAGGYGTWDLQSNNLPNPDPLYGPAGFGNPFNNYSWTAAVHNGELYWGTMDHSYLLFGEFSEVDLSMGLPFNCEDFINDPDICQDISDAFDMIIDIYNPNDHFGADLWRMSSNNTAAVPENFTGVGNNLSYGIRTMETDNQCLFLGMANPMNLSTDCDATDLSPRPNTGGWELIRMGTCVQQQQVIPTLSQWGIIILTIAFLIFGLIVMNRRNIAAKHSEV